MARTGSEFQLEGWNFVHLCKKVWVHAYVLWFFLNFFQRYRRVSARNYCPAFVKVKRTVKKKVTPLFAGLIEKEAKFWLFLRFFLTNNWGKQIIISFSNFALLGLHNFTFPKIFIELFKQYHSQEVLLTNQILSL